MDRTDARAGVVSSAGGANLPTGWAVSSVGGVCRVVGGGTPATAMASYWEGDIAWITSADIQGPRQITPRRSVSQQAILESAANLVPAQSVIVATRVGLGKVAISDVPIAFSQDCHGLLFNREAIDPLYLTYYLGQAVGVFKHVSRGTTINGVTTKQLCELEVVLPPFPEQQRIVAAIEEQFTRLDAAVAALRRVRANLKRYRAAVLKAACEGRLVPTDTLEWQRVKLGALLSRSEYGTSVRCEYGAGGVPVLRIPNIAKGFIDLEDMKFATVPVAINLDSCLHRGDLLVCRTNGSVSLIGQSAVVPETYNPPHAFASYLLRLRFNEAETLPRWVDVWLRSPLGRSVIERDAASSAGQHNISLSWLHRFQVALPPLAEQRRIVAEVERRLSVVDEVEAAVEQQLRRAERLRQAILRRAFAGKLVPQDPSDEPASALLARIRAERRAETPSARPRRGRAAAQQTLPLPDLAPEAGSVPTGLAG